MAHYYWYRTCPLCKQGRLLIFKDISRDQLYLHCEECEWGWRQPREADQKTSGFLTLDEDFEAKAATWNDIEAHGWGEYATNENSRP